MTSLALIDPVALHPAQVAGPVVQGVMSGCFSMEMTSAEYHSLPDSVSCSGLKKLLRSPAHYQAYLAQEFDEDDDNIGTATHCALLEPDRFAQEYVVYDGYKRGKEWTEFKEQNAGKVVLNKVDYDQVMGMCSALMNHKEFPVWKAINSSRREMSVFWTDEETGVQCRVRLDSLSAPFAIWDLKTTSDARPDAFVRQVVRLDYDLQAAMYSEAVRRFTGEHLPFIFIAVETAHPHGIWLHTAGQSMLDNGWIKFRKALHAYKTCTDNMRWPAYENAMSTLELPRYALIAD